MSQPAITTMVKMIEPLSVKMQEQVLNHLREYIQDLQDDLLWNDSFKNSQKQLINAAQQARREIAQGLAEPMNYERL